MFAEACAQGLGGRDRQARRQPSTPPSARKDWLKFKCEHGQELVIGGFTAPRGSREEFGALLVGVYDADGGCATPARSARASTARRCRTSARALRALRPRRLPRSPTRPRFRDATWVEPELVAQLGFAEWTTRRPPAPPALPRPAHRQGRRRRRPRGRLNAEARLEAGFGHQKIRQVWAGDIVMRSQPSGRLRCLTSPSSAGDRPRC